jgi:hypothetical protein
MPRVLDDRIYARSAVTRRRFESIREVETPVQRSRCVGVARRAACDCVSPLEVAFGAPAGVLSAEEDFVEA